MTDPGRLIDCIYEAAFDLAAWPSLLAQLATYAGARGGVLFAASMDGVRWTASPGEVEVYEGFVRGGWLAQNERVPRLIALRHAGFVTDTDVYSPAEIATLPMYTQYLTPLGYDSAAATAIEGLDGDSLIMSVEAFGSDAAARAAIPLLDPLRPHLARASMLAARFKLAQARAAVAALGLIGVAACVVGLGRRLLAGNDMFCAMLAEFGHDTPRGLVLSDARADARLGVALEGLRAGVGYGVSLPLRLVGEQARAVLHVVPMRGQARDLFCGAAAILVLAKPGGRAAPSADLVQALLDLTPAEARLARFLAVGGTLAEAAAALGVTLGTARVQLRSIFEKTGISRQADLVAYLISVAHPAVE